MVEIEQFVPEREVDEAYEVYEKQLRTMWISQIVEDVVSGDGYQVGVDFATNRPIYWRPSVGSRGNVGYLYLARDN